MMNRKLWVILTAVMASTMLLLTPALADWIPVPDAISIDKGLPVEGVADSGSAIVMFDAVFTNISGADIEGTLRVLVEPTNGTADPINPDGTTDTEGQDPHVYYNLDSTLQEDLMEAGESVTVSIIFLANYDDSNALIVPTFELTAEANDASVDFSIFRKKVSKTPELFSGDAHLVEMPRYVNAQNTKGQRLYRDKDTEGFIACPDSDGDGTVDCPDNDWELGIITQVKPLIVIYVQEVEDTLFNNVPGYDEDADLEDDGWRLANDIYAAVSYDEGATWKRRNISRTSMKSSYEIENGLDYPGDSERADVVVAGDQVLVTWIDKYCQSGNPWDLPDTWSDDYLVKGSQKSVDYLDVKGDEEPRPDLGERPFSCLWAARGVLQTDPDSPDFGSIVWYKGEQLTTGVRDAYRNFTAGIAADPATPANVNPSPGGFAVAWQEDPKGLKAGKGRGPGAGMSGACVNHKTDIWYSFISYGDTFAAIDENFVPTGGDGEPIPTGDGGGYTPYLCLCGHVYDPYEIDPENPVKFIDLPSDWTCPVCGRSKADFEKVTRPHALNHFSTPVRVTDNAVCKERQVEEVWGHRHDPNVTDCDYYYEGGTNSQPIYWDDLPDDWACPKCGGTKADTFKVEAEFIKYRKEGAPYCEQYKDNPRVDKDGNIIDPSDPLYEVAYYTKYRQDAEGNLVMVPLDGNTGASRPNISLVNWKGETLALIAYEETKGIGVGGDKETAGMEQKAPFPLVVLNSDPLQLQGTFVNQDCRSCHYDHVVPRDRFVPISDPTVCQNKGGVWKPEVEAYYPYSGYPYTEGEPVYPDGCDPAIDPDCEPLVSWDLVDDNGEPISNFTPCVKFEEGKTILPRDYSRTLVDAYYALPEHLPGWHARPLDCSSCHLPYMTKDLDLDDVPDRVDKCPGTPTDDPYVVIDMDPNSELYGCADTQDPNAPDNNKDETDRFRHGKNVVYHSFGFDDAETISHGHVINLPNAYDWIAPGSSDRYENARRVMLVPNPMYEEPVIDPVSGEVVNDTRADVTLGLLYKEGKNGQGAPADAVLRLFRDGFDIENIDTGALNLSSSTPYLFQDPYDVGNEDGSGLWGAGDGTGDLIGNHNTPKIDKFYWTTENLQDSSGYWYKDEASGDNLWASSAYNGFEVPEIRANPFENVFSTRLSIRGNFIVAGFAYCANWAAGKKAKDHYDFYVRTSEDGGKTWTLPANASQLKNNQESVSDCRIYQPPPTIFAPGADAETYTNPEFRVMPQHDFYDHNTFFVAIGTKENQAQPAPNEIELEEEEVFLDVFYSRTQDRGQSFENVTKQVVNPDYDETMDPNKKYIDNLDGQPTENQFDDYGVENEPNLAVVEYLDTFDWLAKGDANQGDVQIITNPNGTMLHSIWQQDLPLSDDLNQTHFQGSDVWFRKIEYLLPEQALEADVNADGEVTWDDGLMILDHVGTTAMDPDFLWTADVRRDNVIDKKDFQAWKHIYKADKKANLRIRWAAD